MRESFLAINVCSCGVTAHYCQYYVHCKMQRAAERAQQKAQRKKEKEAALLEEFVERMTEKVLIVIFGTYCTRLCQPWLVSNGSK